MLTSIIEDIRKSVPDEIAFSQPIPGSSSSTTPTTHIDGFLYDNDAIDNLLVPQGKASTHCCMDCGSTNVRPLETISHSMSVTQLKYIFQYVLPDLQKATLVDVGSRLGAVLYGAYLFSGAEQIVGVEIDAGLCDLQQRVIQKYHMTDRVEVVCGDICNHGDLLKTADVVVLNNVFEYFCPLDVQNKIWVFIREHMTRPGSLLVTCPSLTDSLGKLQTYIDVSQWVDQLDLSGKLHRASRDLFDTSDIDDTDLDQIFCYRVK